jgi:uncharacterized membrane protein
MPNSEQRMIKTALSPNRLEALTDGVFAIAMTLLVLGLGEPVLKGSSMPQEFTQLLDMWPKFISYVVTFLILGYMWSMHHWQFSFIKRSDSVLIWINILFLMFTSLLPFSTFLLGEYIGQQLPVLVYGGNYMACMLMCFIKWSYATGKSRLVDTNIDWHEVRIRNMAVMIGIALFAIAMGISYLNPIVSIGLFAATIISAMIFSTLRFRIRVAEQVAK